jgi:membrane-associated protease RseP (regulator of RpoE activity)
VVYLPALGTYNSIGQIIPVLGAVDKYKLSCSRKLQSMLDDLKSPLQEAAERVEVAIADLFSVHDVTLGVPQRPQAIRLRGQLQVASDRAYPQIAARLREMEYTAVLRHDEEQGLDELLVMPGVLPQVERPRLWVHALLFGATVFTTLYVGASMVETAPGDDFWWPLLHFWEGWPFSLSLLSILLAHELGHYFTGRHYRVPVSLPFFIPIPLPPLGTMGAVIRMKAPVTNRRAMLDIGSAGPLVGLAVAIPVLIIGLSLSHVEPLPVDQPYSMEGNSLLYLLVKYLMFGQWLPSGGVDVFIHSVAFAGWAGLLVTSFNLLPVGQLDGGHVLYSLLGDRAQRLTWPIILALAGLGLAVWPGWFLWAGLVFLFGQGHPGPLDSITRLDTRRKVVAVAVLLVFVLTFTPIPLVYVFPTEAEGVVMRGLPVLVAGLVCLRRVGCRSPFKRARH